jgi:hypothetical protein
MAGFDTSAEFEQAVDELTKIGRVEGLQSGYAILDADLKVIDWHRDEWAAEEHVGCGACKVKIPDLDGRYHFEASLIAGLAWTLLSDRHMASELEASTDVSAWSEGQKRAEYHLFSTAAKAEVA